MLFIIFTILGYGGLTYLGLFATLPWWVTVIASVACGVVGWFQVTVTSAAFNILE